MISRRALLAATFAGIPVGAGGGLLAWNELRGKPAIRLIGKNDSIAAVVDTGTTRLLVLAGDVDPDVWSGLELLGSVGRDRIDVVVATLATLATRSALKQTWRNSALLLPVEQDASAPPLAGNVQPVIAGATVEIGEGARVDVVVGRSSATEPPPFGLQIEINGTSITVLSAASMIRRLAADPTTLLVVPGSVSVDELAQTRSAMLVGTEPRPDDYAGPYRQVYASNATTFDIVDGRLSEAV